MENRVPVVSFKNISKTFGETKANSDISMDIYAGEILSLLGENGSGKTTLMNMLSGIYAPDSGEIYVRGEKVSIASPQDAINLSIGMVHQHFKLVDVMTATENVMLGLKEKYDKKACREKIKEICDRYGFEVDPDQKVYDMSVSQKQTLEIVKVLYRRADILILDEPTAVLTPQETEKLFAVLRNMRSDGKMIIIITHKLAEVLAISDRVAILRKGEFITAVDTKSLNPQQLTDLMVGRSVNLDIRRPEVLEKKERIRVKDLTVKDNEGVNRLSDVSFDVKSGEILGIAGISGCGQKELLEAIAGLQNIDKGSIVFIEDDGKEEELTGKSARDIMNLGVSLAFVPEDRLGMGLVGSMDIVDNMMLRSYRNGNLPFTDKKDPEKLAQSVVKELSVATPGVNAAVSSLSGGNVQKVLVGREIASSPKVLMTAYAVRGLDINSSMAIYDLLNEQKKNGAAVIFVGEDLDVILALSDRIMVLCQGKVAGIVDGRSADKNTVGLMMTGITGEA